MAQHNLAVFLALFLLVSGAANAGWLQQQAQCETVYVHFPYCLEFLTGLYYKPSTKCCNHIKKLNTLAKQDKGNVELFCGCIEGMVKGLNPPLQNSRIIDLPVQCNMHLSFPISESMDCSTVSL